MHTLKDKANRMQEDNTYRKFYKYISSKLNLDELLDSSRNRVLDENHVIRVQNDKITLG
jgi:hypothetical protein